MADELQGLLDRINEEGLKKADDERRAVLEQAKSEAEEIVAAAESEAEAILKDAREEADLFLEKGNESLKQAARDVLLSLREQLESRVVRVAEHVAAEGLSDASVAPAIAALIEGFGEESGEESRIEVLLSEDHLETLGGAIKAELSEDFRERVTLSPVAEIRSGFKLSFSESSVSYDFTDESLGEVMGLFLNDRLAELVSEASKGSA